MNNRTDDLYRIAELAIMLGSLAKTVRGDWKMGRLETIQAMIGLLLKWEEELSYSPHRRAVAEEDQ